MKKVFVFILMMAVFAACNKNEETWEPPVIPEAPKIGTIAFADITDAAALYITSSASDENSKTKSSSETIPNSLFKITQSGENVKVQFTTENQDSVTQPIVFLVKDLSEKYLYMSYNNVWKYDTIIYDYDSICFIPCLEHTQVLVKKDDGTVFKMASKEIINPYNYFDYDDYDDYEDYKYLDFITQESNIQVDYNGNVYYEYSGDIYKIYTHGKEVYITQINRDDMKLEWEADWLVDQQGNVWINNQFARLASGEFTRAPGDLESAFITYGDSEGFYSIKVEYDDDNYRMHQNILRYMQAEAPEMQWEDLKRDNTWSDFLYYKSNHIFPYKDKTIIYSSDNNGNFLGDWLIIKNRNDIQVDGLMIYPDPMFFKGGFEYYGNRHPCTEKYLYKLTEQEIWRLKIETGEVDLLYNYSKEYIIKDIKVKNNIVTCNAFELRKGNDVVIEIYEDKSVHHVESTNNEKIIYLERLN